MTFEYRKKPVVIEAFEFTQRIHDDVWYNEDGSEDTPDWFYEAMNVANLVTMKDSVTHLTTDSGVHAVQIGDWVIKGVEGELYPCSASVFAATYEAVVPEPTSSLPPHQQRVVVERAELYDKFDKLATFTHGDLFLTINADEQARLNEQLAIMKNYLNILDARIKAF